MAVDWDGLVLAPLMAVFGETQRVAYTTAAGEALTVDGVFDEGAAPLRLVGDPDMNAVAPILGVRLAQFPADFDPRNAQGDTFTILRTGKTYSVRDGRPDSHGWARIEGVLQ